MVLYACLNERKVIRCWKRAAFNMIAGMVLKSYTHYRENYWG
jgi:hypothetical protein